MPTAARPAQAHSHSHAGGPAGAKPKLYNPRHPERTLLYQTIAEHFETWHQLASAGQFDGQGDHRTPEPPSPMSAKPFANTSNAASLPMALPGRGVMTVDTTTSWPIPAKAGACAPRATRQRCGDGSAPDGRRFSPPCGAPVGALGAEATALLHAARRDGGDAQMDNGAQIEPADWDLAAPPVPDFEVDQRISW